MHSALLNLTEIKCNNEITVYKTFPGNTLELRDLLYYYSIDRFVLQGEQKKLKTWCLKTIHPLFIKYDNYK